MGPASDEPGGRCVVIGHAPAAGSGLRDTNTMHRIDEASVKSEVEAAGFKLEGESASPHNGCRKRGKPKSREPARPRTNADICALALRRIGVR